MGRMASAPARAPGIGDVGEIVLIDPGAAARAAIASAVRSAVMILAFSVPATASDCDA